MNDGNRYILVVWHVIELNQLLGDALFCINDGGQEWKERPREALSFQWVN